MATRVRAAMALVRFLAVLLGLLAVPAAQALSPDGAQVTQRLGAALPLDAQLIDADDRTLRLGAYFGDGRAVLLVPSYYRCPNLCGLVMHGLIDALVRSGVPAESFRVVALSIDPAETPEDARLRRTVDLAYAAQRTGEAQAGARDPITWRRAVQLTVGSAGTVRAVTQAAGFAFEPDPGAARRGDASAFSHAAAVIVATPDGRIARYFFGTQFEPAEMRRAIEDARAGRTGTVADHVLAWCSHFAPEHGRGSRPVTWSLRALALLALAAGGLWFWRHRSGQRRPAG